MQKVLVRLIAIQAGFFLACAAVLYVKQGLGFGLAAIYGGAIAAVMAILLAWRMRQAARPGGDLKPLYIGAVERTLLALALFGVGIAFLRLEPIGVILGFASAQLAYFIGAGPLRRYVLSTEDEGRHGE